MSIIFDKYMNSLTNIILFQINLKRTNVCIPGYSSTDAPVRMQSFVWIIIIIKKKKESRPKK